MLKTIEKAAKLGIRMAMKTGKLAEKEAMKMLRGRVNAKRAKSLVKKLAKEATKARKYIIDTEMKKSAKQIVIISKKELERMRGKITALERELRKKTKTKAKPKKKAKRKNAIRTKRIL